MIDDERMDKIYDAIERADLPVIFHSGYDCVSPDLIHSTPERALNMIKSTLSSRSFLHILVQT